MDTIQALSLALLQGLTEFLPISSSAHLILLPELVDWPDQGLAFDVAVHIGTLLAVIAYFRSDLVKMVGDWIRSLTGGPTTDDSRLTWYILFGTIPVGIVGILISLNDTVENALRSPLVIAGSTILFALVLWWAERIASEQRSASGIIWKDALIVGLFQAVALIPGTSRSGITITAGLFLGLNRETAARFSFLLSIPVIVLAGLLKGYQLTHSTDPVQWQPIAIGVAVSGITAYLTIGWFLRLLDRFGLFPFVIYRLLLGVVLFALFLPDPG